MSRAKACNLCLHVQARSGLAAQPMRGGWQSWSVCRSTCRRLSRLWTRLWLSRARQQSACGGCCLHQTRRPRSCRWLVSCDANAPLLASLGQALHMLALLNFMTASFFQRDVKGLQHTGMMFVGDGEVDRALLDLLQQNIDAATAAGQAQAAEFMTKVRMAAMKFVITA